MKQVNKWLSALLIMGFLITVTPTQAQNTPAGTEQREVENDEDDDDNGKWGLAGLLGLLGLLGLKRRDDDDRKRVSTNTNR